MGGCVSTPNQFGMAHSNTIGRQIEEVNKQSKKEYRVLLLGSSESGKSTIIKQMKITYQDGFSTPELAGYKPIVYKNVLDSVQAVIVYMKKIGWQCEDYDNQVLAEKILKYKLDTGPTNLPSSLLHLSSSMNPQMVFSSEIAEAIHQVWKDPIILKVMDKHSTDFYLMDSARYFFEKVLCIGSPGYLPSEMDVLRARQKTYGISEIRFMVNKLPIHMFKIGGQGLRRKWIHHFESVTSIIFCTALSEYDQVSLEEKTQNRMHESLALFGSIINSQWFLRTSIILLFNKIDVFQKKLPKVPLERHFPEYTGGADINKAVKYILWKFMQSNHTRLSIYPHIIQATEIKLVGIGLISLVIRRTILLNAIKTLRPL